MSVETVLMMSVSGKVTEVSLVFPPPSVDRFSF